MAESGGQANAQNPSSSASGLFQFTDPTWSGLVNQYGSKYGLTASGKDDPGQQYKAAQLIAQNEYLPALQSIGVNSPSPDDYEQVHFWGVPNFKKLAGAASPDTPLKAVLGDQFQSVYGPNASLFGNNPNVTVAQAGAAVDRHLPGGSTNMLPPFMGGSYQGQQMPPGAAGGGAVPVPAQNQHQQQPPGQQATDPSQMAPVQAQQAPLAQADGWINSPSMIQRLFGMKNNPSSMFSRANLLRMASGFGAGNPNGEGFANAASALLGGVQQDFQNQQSGQQMQQTGQMDQAEIGMDRQRTQSGIIASAAPLIEMGYSPDLVFKIASGGMSAQQAAQVLANAPQPLGRVAYGDVWRSSDGTSYQQLNRPYGAPMFENMNTGKMVNTLPPDANRAQDPAIKTNQVDDANAENAAYNSYTSANNEMGTLGQLRGVLGQVKPGSSLGDVVTRNISQLTGMTVNGNDPAAQQYANGLFQQLAGARIQMLRGLGRLDLPEVKNAMASGANWMDNPQALNTILSYREAQLQYAQDQYDAWQQSSPQDQANGYRAFSYNWAKSNPFNDYATNYIKAHAGDDMQQQGPASAPVQAAGTGQPNAGTGLGQFWK